MKHSFTPALPMSHTAMRLHHGLRLIEVESFGEVFGQTLQCDRLNVGSRSLEQPHAVFAYGQHQKLAVPRQQQRQQRSKLKLSADKNRVAKRAGEPEGTKEVLRSEDRQPFTGFAPKCLILFEGMDP